MLRWTSPENEVRQLCSKLRLREERGGEGRRGEERGGEGRRGEERGGEGRREDILAAAQLLPSPG